jgi:cytochrome b subunit of formate dehydrogenase
MRAWLTILLLAAPALGANEKAGPPRAETAASAAAETSTPASQRPVAPPPAGSHVAADKNNCILCHGEADLWEGPQRRLFISREQLGEDVHWKKGVNCHDCHGGNYDTQNVNQAHAKEDNFRAAPGEVRKYCAVCHKEQALELVKGVHDKAGEKNERGQGTPLGCDKCHGAASHHLLPAHDTRSAVFVDHQVKTCGGCHAENLESYVQSVHGQGLYKLGLLITAACADCHGAHGIYRAPDKRSTLHPTHVAATCGKCHRFIEERLQGSIHGNGSGPGGTAERAAPGGSMKQKPSCTSCHQGHDLPSPESSVFRLQVPNRCGNCHAELSKHYSLSVHGELTALGYAPAAKCSDCHGAHDILPTADPKSHLSADHRLQTCERCHPGATRNFLDFDPHADYTSPARDPVLYGVYVAFTTLVISVFGFFGLHCLLWFVRSLVEVIQHGRPKGLVPGGVAYERFGRFHRLSHTFMLVSFLGLALTGLPLKYSTYEWAKQLAHALGGFASTAVWHRIFGIVTMLCFVVYIVRLSQQYRAGRQQGQSRRRLVFGPDSPLPNLHDVVDFFKMIRWFVGLGPKPTFERWSYWEKFDFWGACADVVIIGSTGFILWFPNLFCSFLPGVTLNIAKVIHSTQALLATGFVFAIHFFNTHLRAEKFPADMSVLTGLVSEEEVQAERPAFFQRMLAEGKLEALRAPVPSRRRLWLVRLGGFAALVVGLGLLAGMVVAGIGG